MACSNIVLVCFILSFVFCEALIPHYEFSVKEASHTRLSGTKNFLTVNGQFPGPTLHVRKGDTIFVKVHNNGKYNITIHWDGPEYIAQGSIKPGEMFSYKIIFTTKVGTLWWHAHSDWSQATVHGAIVVHPQRGTSYPSSQLHKEMLISTTDFVRRRPERGPISSGGSGQTN